MENQDQKKPVSARKLAANKANSERSTGPRWKAGKERSSQNARRHGLFAKRLFQNPKQQAEADAVLDHILECLRSHYEPIDFMEELSVVRIANAIVRSSRAARIEQELLDASTSSQSPLERDVLKSISLDQILKIESLASRQLAQAIRELEHLQEVRGAKQVQSGGEDNPTEEQDSVAEGPTNIVQPQGDQSQPSSGQQMGDSREATDSLVVGATPSSRESNPASDDRVADSSTPEGQ